MTTRSRSMRVVRLRLPRDRSNFRLGFPLDLVLAEALAQVFAVLLSETAPPSTRMFRKQLRNTVASFSPLVALELRRRLDAGHDSKAVFSAFGQRVSRTALLQAVQLVDHHPEPAAPDFREGSDDVHRMSTQADTSGSAPKHIFAPGYVEVAAACVFQPAADRERAASLRYR